MAGAEQAIAFDAPSTTTFDSNGKLIPGPSPEFVAWAKAHNLTTDDALGAAMYDLPAKVACLGETGDPRAIPLLRRALLSQNFMIQGQAAAQLAQLGDKDSIPLIIEACRKAPADAAALLASALNDFDDPEAQRVAREFGLPVKDAK